MMTKYIKLGTLRERKVFGLVGPNWMFFHLYGSLLSCGCWVMVLLLLGPRVISSCSQPIISLGCLLSSVSPAGVISYAIWFSPLAYGFVSRVFLWDFTQIFYLCVLFILGVEFYLCELFIHDMWFVHSHSDFYLCDFFFLHGLSLISTFYLLMSHPVKWVSAYFSAVYLMIFLSVSLCIFLSHLPHDFRSVSSYGFFLCDGFYPWSDCEFTLQVWIVSYSTWLSKGISMIEYLLF